MFIFELQNKKENKTMAHLTLKQRYEISALFARNISQKEIALQVGVSESTISNEKNAIKKVAIYTMPMLQMI